MIPLRALHRQLKDHDKALVQVETELAETKERISTMEEHLKSVNTEQLHTQRLVDAKIKEIETEDHLKQLAERERGRFHAEFRKCSEEIAELSDKINGVQNNVFKGNEQMEQFKLQMNWNQEELEQWALAAKQKEEDNLALQVRDAGRGKRWSVLLARKVPPRLRAPLNRARLNRAPEPRA